MGILYLQPVTHGVYECRIPQFAKCIKLYGFQQWHVSIRFLDVEYTELEYEVRRRMAGLSTTEENVIFLDALNFFRPLNFPAYLFCRGTPEKSTPFVKFDLGTSTSPIVKRRKWRRSILGLERVRFAHTNRIEIKLRTDSHLLYYIVPLLHKPLQTIAIYANNMPINKNRIFHFDFRITNSRCSKSICDCHFRPLFYRVYAVSLSNTPITNSTTLSNFFKNMPSKIYNSFTDIRFVFTSLLEEDVEYKEYAVNDVMEMMNGVTFY
jgi:hypothetical protein